MEFDEKLFHFAWKTKKRFSKKITSKNASLLSKNARRLTTFSSAFFNFTPNIKPAEKNGALIGNSLFIPEFVDFFDSEEKNYNLYLYRIIFETVAMRLGYKFKENKLSRSDLNFLTLIALPTIIKKAHEDYPVLEGIFNEFRDQLFRQNNSNSIKRSKSYFYEIWLCAILDKSLIDKSRLSPRQRNIINKAVANTNLTPTAAIKEAMTLKSEFKKYKLRQECLIEFLPIFSRLATPAQRLTIRQDKDSKTKEADSDKEKTQKESKTKETVKNIKLDEEDPDCNPANLLMEGVQTADLFTGGKKMLDGSDDMDDHFDAIEDLDIREMTRSSEQTQSIFKAETALDIDYIQDEPETEAPHHFKYDEWDYKRRRYKKNWCYLQENKLSLFEENEVFHKYQKKILKETTKERRRLKQKITNTLIQKRPKKRQKEGAEIDIDALISAKADIISGHTSSQNLYISNRKTPSDISVVLLIDSSLSADSWVNGRRIIDIAKESIIVIEDVLEGVFNNIMIASFYSNTRKNCIFNIVKAFHEKWQTNAPKLDQVKPTGYTRIGVALRHTFHHLNKVKTKKKVVLLLSDGKPTDYDAYEGKLGINDVRQCVREANKDNIFIYSLAIDKDSKFYFPQLFGAQNYQVLNSPKSLPEHLIKLFSNLL